MRCFEPIRTLRRLGAVLFAGLLLSACARPGAGLTGNDTGGIIPWSEANRAIARDLADQHCARYGKVVRFTSATMRYGDYIAFSCRYQRTGGR